MNHCLEATGDAGVSAEPAARAAAPWEEGEETQVVQGVAPPAGTRWPRRTTHVRRSTIGRVARSRRSSHPDQAGPA